MICTIFPSSKNMEVEITRQMTSRRLQVCFSRYKRLIRKKTWINKQRRKSVLQWKSSWDISRAHEGAGSNTYLYVGRVPVTLFPVDVQAQLLAQLGHLRSSLAEINPRGLVLLSLIHISSQVVQQLWEEEETLLTNNVNRKHLKPAVFGFILRFIKNKPMRK